MKECRSNKPIQVGKLAKILLQKIKKEAEKNKKKEQ